MKPSSEIRTPSGIGIDEARGSAAESSQLDDMLVGSQRTPILLDDVKRIRVEPGDRLLVTIDDLISNDDVDRIKRTVEEVLAVPALVVSGGVEITLVKAAAQAHDGTVLARTRPEDLPTMDAIPDPPPAPPADTESRG